MNIEGLSLDQMRVALAVAEAGSLSGAARRFNRTQSAVSYAVVALERQLGIQLFDRSGHRARPSRSTAVLLQEMEAIIARANGLRASARALQEGFEPQIQMSVECTCDLSALTPVLAAFQSAFPSIVLDIKIGCMSTVLERTLSGSCAIGIAATPANLPPPLVGYPLWSTTFVPVTSPGHPLALCEEPVPHHEADAYVSIVLQSSGATSADPTPVAPSARVWRVDDLSAKLALVRAGLGWGYMPHHLVQNDLDQGVLKVLVLAGMRRQSVQDVFAIVHESRSASAPIQWLLAHLRERSLLGGATSIETGSASIEAQETIASG